MSRNLQTRLSEALQDERKALATYRAVIKKFGPVRPFVNIVEAEQRHAEAILSLFERHGLPVPADSYALGVEISGTLEEVCRDAIAGEKENIAMYQRLLAETPEPDARRVLENLQAASRDRHLPAFGRCVSRHGSRNRRH